MLLLSTLRRSGIGLDVEETRRCAPGSTALVQAGEIDGKEKASEEHSETHVHIATERPDDLWAVVRHAWNNGSAVLIKLNIWEEPCEGQSPTYFSSDRIRKSRRIGIRTTQGQVMQGAGATMTAPASAREIRLQRFFGGNGMPAS